MTEIIVSLMLFAIIATTAGYGMLNALALTQQSRASQTAMSIASSDLDQMRLRASANAAGVFSVLSTTSPIVKSIGGTAYSVTRQSTWQQTDGSTGACGTGTGTLQYKNVTETVSWRATNGVQRSVTMSSAIAPLSNINSDTTGTIVVTVTGSASGQPIPGATISITPTSTGTGLALTTAPQNTDINGCSFGLLVNPGTYSVTASLAGYVDINQSGTAATSNPVSVVAGQNTLVSLAYDQAATFPLTYPAGATPPTNLAVSFYHPNPGTTAFNTSGIPPATATPPASVKAYPWSDGYAIIGGTYIYTAAASSASCLNSNPGSWTTPRAGDGAIGIAPAQVTAAAGATAVSTAVQLGTFTLSNTTALKGKYITAVTATPPSGSGDPGCALTQTLTFPAVGNGVSTLTLALPYGTWQLYAGSTAGSTTTALPSSGSGVLGLITGGLLNSSGSATTITLDPRTVPAP
ncbi:hypothetical protein BH11ACT4_BH11ACT4_00110 [soil metagenome]